MLSPCLRTLVFAAIVMAATARPVAAQQPIVATDGRDVTITGCLARAAALPTHAPTVLVWTRGDIMLAAPATATPPSVATTQRLFYWIDEQERLIGHLGKRVEIKGEFEDFEEGQIEIDRNGAHVAMTLHLGGREERVRVPASWIGPAVTDDLDVTFIARKVDVGSVQVLGPCH